MAVVAWRIGGNMVRRFPGRGNAVVAACACPGDHRVVEIDLMPVGGGGMACLARGRGGHMRCMLTGGPVTVMA